MTSDVEDIKNEMNHIGDTLGEIRYQLKRIADAADETDEEG